MSTRRGTQHLRSATRTRGQVHILLVKEAGSSEALIGGAYTTRTRAEAAGDRYPGMRVIMDPIPIDQDLFISIKEATITKQEDECPST